MVKIEDLKRINMLSEVPDHLLEMISREAQLNIYGTDTQLFSIGETIEIFYMMIMGQVALKVALTPQIDVILDNIQAGGAFGSSALFSERAASYAAICQEPCEVITLKGERMQSLFKENSELAYYVMKGVAGQYKKTMDQRAGMIIKTLEERPDLKQDIHDIGQLTPAY